MPYTHQHRHRKAFLNDPVFGTARIDFYAYRDFFLTNEQLKVTLTNIFFAIQLTENQMIKYFH